MILYNLRFQTLVGSLSMIGLCVPIAAFAAWVAITTLREASAALQIPAWLLFFTMLSFTARALWKIYSIPKKIPADATSPENLATIVPPALSRLMRAFSYLLAFTLIAYTTYGLVHGQILVPAKRGVMEFTGKSILPLAISAYSLAANIANDLFHQHAPKGTCLVRYRNFKAASSWLAGSSFLVAAICLLFS